MFIQAINDGLTHAKGVDLINRRKLSIVLSGLSLTVCIYILIDVFKWNICVSSLWKPVEHALAYWINWKTKTTYAGEGDKSILLHK